MCSCVVCLLCLCVCSTPIVAVRADVGRLPFATGSVDAIHAGAAIHCWPNPQAAMAEISRVLKPGGIFVASTFLTPFAPLGELVGDSTIRPISQVRALGGLDGVDRGSRVLIGGLMLQGRRDGWRVCVGAGLPVHTVWQLHTLVVVKWHIEGCVWQARYPAGNTESGKPSHFCILSTVVVSSLTAAAAVCPSLPVCGQAQARSSAYRLWEEQELIDLCSSVGLDGYRRIRSFRYIMFTARKPDGAYL
jgi:hypothetical protein